MAELSNNPRQFVIKTDTNIGMLDAELRAALTGVPDLTIEYSTPRSTADVLPGPDNPVTISIAPGSISASDVNKVIKAHKPNLAPDGMPLTDAQKEVVDLAQKVLDGTKLTGADAMLFNQAVAQVIVTSPGVIPPDGLPAQQ